MFKSIKAQMIVAYSVLIRSMMVLMAVSLIQFAKTETESTNLENKMLPQMFLAERMAFNVVSIQNFITDVAATHRAGGPKEAETSAQEFTAGINQFLEDAQNDVEESNRVTELKTIGKISKTVNLMDRAAQQNAAGSEELAATAEELNGQAMQLQQVIAFFRV